MVLLLLIVACSSEFEITRNDNIGYQKRINQVINEKDISIQRIMYSMLEKEDKHKYWHDKLDNLLKEKSLNDKQLSVLNLIREHLTIEIFENNENNEKIIFKTFHAKKIITDLVENFELKFITENFYSLKNGDLSIVEPPSFDGQAARDCTCNIGSLFTCAVGVDCRSYSPCKSSESGCGFLWQYTCNGNCMA